MSNNTHLPFPALKIPFFRLCSECIEQTLSQVDHPRVHNPPGGACPRKLNWRNSRNYLPSVSQGGCFWQPTDIQLLTSVRPDAPFTNHLNPEMPARNIAIRPYSQTPVVAAQYVTTHEQGQTPIRPDPDNTLAGTEPPIK